jgi:hypothetical protein
MNFEPFKPFERTQPLPPSVAAESTPPSHYFDRVGLVWIVACVLFAVTGGRLLPQLARPDGLRNTLVALGAVAARPVEAAKTSHPTTMASLPLQGANPRQATPGGQVKQEAGPLSPVLFRQF